MKRLLFLFLVLSGPTLAQYTHRSNPGTIGTTLPTITANGQCVTLQAGGTNTSLFAVTGSWTGTISLQGSNDAGATTVALQGYPITTSTGALGAFVNSTTGNGTWVADTFGFAQVQACATAAWTGTASVRIDSDPAETIVQVVGPGGGAVQVTGSLSVSGTADVVSAGAPTTFNANAVCTGSLLLAGEQSASFELNAGTITATFTPQCSGEASGASNWTNGQFKDATGAATNTLSVSNPNALTNLQIVCPASRRAQVCTTAYTSGSATGLANALFSQGGSAAGGGGGTVTQGSAGSNAQAWWTEIGDTTNGPAAVKAASTAVGATDKALAVGLSPNSPTPPGTNLMGKVGIDQTTPGATNGVVLTQTATTQGAGTAGAASGGVSSVQAPDAIGSMNPFSIATFGGNTVSSIRAPAFASATNLTTSCSSATACAATASIQWALGGQTGAEVIITAISSPVGFTVACDTGYDNSATYLLSDCAFNQAGVFKKTLANADLAAGNKFTLSWLGSPSFVRVRVTAVSSGQFTVAGVASTASSLPWPVEAKAPTQPVPVTLTATTSETTLMAAGGSGVFLDLTYLKCSNTSANSNVISVRDATAGTVRDTLVCPAAIGPCEGSVYKVPFAQTTSNANWTVQAGSSTSSVICTAQAVQR